MGVRVVVADDQVLVRTGFRMILDEADDIEVVGEAGDGGEALVVTHRTDPDVVLMDIRMPVMDGIEATRRLRGRNGSRPRVLLLTTFDVDEYVLSGLQAGASGFLLKDTLAVDLVAAIRTVASGDAVVAPSVTRRLIASFVASSPSERRDLARLDVLTRREREVLELITRGLSNAEISAALYVSEGTVKTHVGRILAKLGLRDRVQAVVLGYATGLVPVGDAPDPSG